MSRKIDWQSGGAGHTNKQEYLYCMDNDMVLEMKAETMQIALTFSCYHGDQPPELGGKSQEVCRTEGGEGEERGRRDRRGDCVLILQFAKSSMHPPSLSLSRPSVVLKGGSTGKLNAPDPAESRNHSERNQLQTCSGGLIASLFPSETLIY